MFDDGFEEFALCASPTHRDEETARLFGFHAVDAGCAIHFDIFDQFMVNMMTGEKERIAGHRLHDRAFIVKAAHHTETIIAGRRLDGVLGAFGQLEGHRPIVEHHIDHIGHAACHCAHAVPHVRGEHGHLRG